MTEEREHGTYSTYQWHRLHRVPMCEPCRAANAAYLADWRSRNPERRQSAREDSAANSRALWRLARMYPAEFRVLVAEERAKGSGAA